MIKKIFLLTSILLYSSNSYSSDYLNQMAKNSGFNSWSELSRVASKCRSMMLSNSPRIRRNNCKTSDFDCLMKNTDKYMKEFNNHYDKVLASSQWRNNRCKTWMLGGSSSSSNKVEELEDRIDDLEDELRRLKN